MSTIQRIIITVLGCVFWVVLSCESSDGGISDFDPSKPPDGSDNGDESGDDFTFEDDDDEDGDDDDDEDDTSALDGCDGVDFLFVVDDSRSMSDEQQNLIASFPGFITAITDALELNDYHIMAVDTDAFYGGFWQRQNCDSVLGAGHVGNNENTNCSIEGGQRYLTKEQGDLNEAFACIADVGINGSGYEKPMEAMVNAVSRENAPGGCNEGFIRENAILVVTFITDEKDECITGDPMFAECSAGDPAAWKAALVEAKGGSDRGIVMLGIFGDLDLTDKICEEYDEEGNGAMEAPVLRTFMDEFEEDRRQFCSVCEEDYAECFLAAVEKIDTTCDELE